MEIYNCLICFILLIYTNLCVSRFPRRARPPNIVVILTDDQDIMLGSMENMPKTLRILRQRGTEFENGFVTTPICCASRSSILTGMYVHNHHVLTNNENCTGKEWKALHEKRTFSSYLHKAGYRTAYIGKYLNEYRGDYIPSGYSQWIGLIKNSKFYNYSVNFNGRKVYHGDNYDKDYFTNLIANDTVQFLQRSTSLYGNKPFLAVMSFPAPHGPEDPAPQYSNAFQGDTHHHTPAWNYAPNPDKQWLLQHTGKMEPVHVAFTDFLHRRRLQTLLSVDDAVYKVVSELRDLRQLSNTYILYTSDHGYHLGQFGLLKGKNMPYEFDLKVPFFIRGPNVPRGAKIRLPVANIDIAPTILDMAGLPVPSHMDGRSILPLLKGENSVRLSPSSKWRDTLLIERGKMPKLSKIRERLLKQQLHYSKDIRIELECEKSIYRPPCDPGQQWHCTRSGMGKWRINKCPTSKNDCMCVDSDTTPDNRDIDSRTKREISSASNITNSEEYSEDVLEMWEDEFWSELVERDIIERGEWHQGVFHDEYDEEVARTKRNINDNHVFLRESQLKTVCVDIGNHSVQCSTQVTKTNKKKPSLQDKVNQLKHKLQDLKMRKRRLRSKKLKRDMVNEGPRGECVCPSQTQTHPLRDGDSPEIFISDADLMRFAEQKRSKRRNRGKTGRRNKQSYKKMTCNIPNMNCFTHSADHWKTPPLWPTDLGKFCFCQNANNNTYWCLRTVNATQNFIYCEFVTGFVSYYNLETDPHQLHNSIYQLEIPILEQLSEKLRKLRDCQGWRQCEALAKAYD